MKIQRENIGVIGVITVFVVCFLQRAAHLNVDVCAVEQIFNIYRTTPDVRGRGDLPAAAGGQTADAGRE